MPEPLRLMAVLAHPDDESLGVGGLLARSAAEGVETYVVTATRGERGRYRGLPEGEGHPGREELARIREAELRAAAAVLGVRELVLLGYGDGALDRADPREVTARIAAEIRRLKPHVVITFGADGIYGHPDHVAISQLATAAVAAAGAGPGDAPAAAPHSVSKLYYYVWEERAHRAYNEGVRRIAMTVGGVERHGHPWPAWAITTRIDTAKEWATVWRAASCHESQVTTYGDRLQNLSPEHHEAIWGLGTYYRAFSLVNGGAAVETDLFDGLR